MELEGLLTHLQAHATCPCPEPDQDNPSPYHISWRFILILSYHLRLGLPSCLFPAGFPTKALYTPLIYPIHATSYPAYLNRLYLIIQIIFGEEYRSLNSSLCCLLHSPFTLHQSIYAQNSNAIIFFLTEIYRVSQTWFWAISIVAPNKIYCTTFSNTHCFRLQVK